MNLFALIFLASVAISLQFNQLPPIWLSGLFFAALSVQPLIPSGKARLVLVATLAGLCLVHLTFWKQLSQRLGAKQQGMVAIVHGKVVGVPVQRGNRSRFVLEVERWPSETFSTAARRLSLTWFGGSEPAIQPGERWQLQVKLRSPRTLANPGGFDYPGWLFRQRIHAVGYVVSSTDNQRLSVSPSIDSLRQNLAAGLVADAENARYVGLMQALLVGLRSDVSAATWDLLRATGTSHLLAISGLHIGMMAGWGFAIGGLFWWLCQLLSGRLPSPQGDPAKPKAFVPLRLNRNDFATTLSVLAALLYAALAGFTLPTQRALIMLSVVMLVRFFRRHADPLTPLSMALVVILLHDPLAPLSAGFWLSFSAVLILIGTGVRAGAAQPLWKRALITHVSMGFLMFPLTALFFGQGSLVAPLANLIAIPYVSLLVVPPLMIWLLVSPLSSKAGGLLLEWADFALSGLIDILQLLQRLLPAEITVGSIDPLTFGTLACASLLFVLPAIRRQRWLIIPLALPFCWSQIAPLAAGRLKITALNVQDGLAVVVRSANYTLLFGAGGQGRGGRSRVESVLMPFLQAESVRSANLLIVPDPVKGATDPAITLGEQVKLGDVLAACDIPLQWQVDDVEFVLFPVGSSCALSIRLGESRILLAGKLDAAAIAALLRSAESRVDLLVFQPADASAMGADLVTGGLQHLVFSVAHDKSGEFVHQAAQMHYKIRGVTTYRTDRSGAIEFFFSSTGLAGQPGRYRQEQQRAWHPGARRGTSAGLMRDNGSPDITY